MMGKTSSFRTNKTHFGAHQKLFKYFKTSDHEEFFKFTKMSVEHLLS